METPETQNDAPERNARRERIGLVISDKMDKSITVATQRRVKHPLYSKYQKKTSKVMAHDENNDANEGDTVRVMECRPYSKNKRWRLIEVLERAK